MDEATFKINDQVNKHNYIYWNGTNPHIIIDKEVNVPCMTIWGGIWSNSVVEPFFFEDNVTSQNYVQMLKDNTTS
jgi:hypothetical protein